MRLRFYLLPILLCVSCVTLLPAEQKWYYNSSTLPPGSLQGLAVVGTPRPIPDEADLIEIQIEKVLAGSCGSDIVRVRCDKPLPPQRQVFAVLPAEGAQYLSFSVPCKMNLVQEQEMLALGGVELDSAALHARSIVVARELSRDDQGRQIEVVRSLLGSESRAGDRIHIDLIAPLDILGIQPGPGQPLGIYFLNEIDRSDPKAITGSVVFRRPRSHETAVVAAIKRRESHPVEEVEGSDKVQQEVLFRGPIAEAVAMLGSDFDPIVQLGRRRLLYEQRQDRTFLPRLIAPQLSRTNEMGPGLFRPLHRLIELLRESPKDEFPDVLVRGLLDRRLAHLHLSPVAPVAPSRRSDRERDLIGEEDQEDVNHGLVWLMHLLDEKTQQSVYGPKLLLLRDRTTGATRREVQLLLDVTGFEALREEDEARRRCKGIKAVASPYLPPPNMPLSVAFSPDGNFWRPATETTCASGRHAIGPLPPRCTAPAPSTTFVFPPTPKPCT
jgi:hypothetical protein